MFGGSCPNVKVESLKSSERFNFYIYMQPFIRTLPLFHLCSKISLVYACKNYTTVEICLNSKSLFTWRWGTPGKGDNLLSRVNSLSIKSLIWSPHHHVTVIKFKSSYPT